MRLPIFIFLIFTFIQLPAQVKTGIEMLEESNFAPLQGKRAGLITNPTGVNSKLVSTADILHKAQEVDLVALFGPEHGIRGDFSAGAKVDNIFDPHTGLPVYSLYGATRKPTPEMLDGIDILIFDIQDIGSRSYTYISTLGLAMEAAAENNIEFMVLDRPNPLGGNKFEGPLVEKEFISFVSQFPIPYVHGFTVGELAVFLNCEGLLSGRVNLTVIEMEGWQRDMLFEDTGLPWVPASPHIPHAHSSYYYPVSGILGELYIYNIGVGYTLPFQMVAADWVDADKLAGRLNDLDLPGVIFRPVHYRPYYSVLKDTMVHGVQIHLTDIGNANLSLIQFYIMQELNILYPDRNPFDLAPARQDMFDKVTGSDQIRLKFSRRFMVEDIIDLWNRDAEMFVQKARDYFIYESP
jgi:uncharacterized protein YbbC (DUF1343 family)